MSTDVVVCGAGVGGLATAHALSALGLRVLVIEKQPSVRAVAKGEVFQPSALAALRTWGVEQRLLELGALGLHRIVVRDQCSEPMLSLDYRGLPGPDQDLLAHDYPTILTAMTDCLDFNVELRRGVLADELLRDETGRVVGVRVKEHGQVSDIHARLVVAADGVSSRLRRAASIEVRRLDYPHRLLCLELPASGEQPPDFSAYVTDRGMRLCYPLPGDRIRLYLQVAPDELRGLDEPALAAWCHTALHQVPALRQLIDRAVASLRHKQVLPVSRHIASRLTVPGLVLVGEAAHSVHPMAAQGMRTSVGDAVHLAAELARSGDLSLTEVDDTLLRYTERRTPELIHIGRMSHNATRMTTGTMWLGRWFGRRAARRTSANPQLLRAVTSNMSGIGARPLTTFDRLHQFGLVPHLGARGRTAQSNHQAHFSEQRKPNEI
ncbi:FAD-dependent oxidoreductase [Amycolatopsis sp. cg5]|uniref:FAD-dependent oxidoreductase n=1 Tax=Amycolatopsis sp. cg5 TaxID=3238802 RepID=UPI003526939D